MRKGIELLLMMTLLAAFGNAQERGVHIKVELDDEFGEKFVAYENSWAIVIGIDEYNDDSFPRLHYAANDARAIAGLLTEVGFPEENITTLVDGHTNLDDIRSEFVTLSRSIGRNDRLLVYWAGHGVTQQLPRGGEMGYLVPADGKYNALYSTCFSMDEIRRLTDLVAAKHVLFLVDACYGGLSAYCPRGLDDASNQYLRQLTTAEAIQIITAGTKDEQVVESSRWNHSAFTKALLDGFQSKIVDRDNNGIVTTDELYSYLAPKVFELARSEGSSHRPVYANLKPSEGQFVFLVSVPEYNLVINDLPANNKTLIGGRIVSERQDTVIHRLKRGTYLVEIEAPGYERYSATIDISQDRVLEPKMYTWTESAQRKLLELQGAIRQTRIGGSVGQSFPTGDFGKFVSQTPAASIVAYLEQDVASNIALIVGVEHTEWHSLRKAYGTYHPSWTPEFSFINNASTTVANIGARLSWDIGSVRVSGRGGVGMNFMKSRIQDEVNSVDLRKSDTNIGFTLGLGASLSVTEELRLEMEIHQAAGQAINLTYSESEEFIYGADNVRLGYLQLTIGLSYTLNSLLAED